MPGVIMMGAMFVLFVIEMWLNSKTGGHSHGGPMGVETGPHQGHAGTVAAMSVPERPPRYATASFETDDIKYEKDIARKAYEENMRNQMENPFSDNAEFGPPSEMPPWFIVFYEQYVRQRLEMMNMIRSNMAAPRQIERAPQAEHNHDHQVAYTGDFADSPYIDPESGMPVDPAVYRKMSLHITLLEGGILFHSVFVGMTISITIDGFIILLVAILFHQMFEGLGLGSRIASVPYAKGSIRPWVLVVAFGTTAPIGQAIGLVTRSTYDPNSAFGLIIVGVFNAM